ncbi:unnamed protein product [Musa hybrid cultivar]
MAAVFFIHMAYSHQKPWLPKSFLAFGSSKSASLFLTLNLLFPAFTSACGTTSTSTTPSPKTRGGGKCLVDTLKLATYANVWNDLITVAIGKFPKQPCECCTLINGVIDLNTTMCLCTALKANVLGIHLNLLINLSLLFNYCGKKVPLEFQRL